MASFRRSVIVWLLAGGLGAAAFAEDRPIQFNRDIRPLLADRCFACHGPDAKARQAELRLDTEEGALAPRDDGPAIVRNDTGKSQLWRRIHNAEASERMPPPDSGKQLTAAERALLGRWIEQGAEWQPHWSFIAPTRPTPAGVSRDDWPRSAIDTFVLARLEAEGLSPSPSAARTTLLRRVTLDLTGIPPTPAEVERFLADESPDAFERAVDGLLAAPRYGERMAARWLDAARYADTSGYQSDGERSMWRWRDWVIEALNANMPFDQFTIEQLAGDLLPGATLDQRLATGFNRNHRGNAEGGIIPEEYAVEYVVDRVETTSTVWLGLTIGCVRCHDHKFDPFPQTDFYRLYAFFNNIPEKGRAIKIGNSPPYIATPTRLQQADLARRQAIVNDLQARWQQQQGELQTALGAWLAAAQPEQLEDWQPTDQLAAEHAREESFDGQRVVTVGDTANFGFFDKFTLAAWVWVPKDGGGTLVSRMTDVPQGDGYQWALAGGKLQLNLVKRWLDDATRVETAQPLAPESWHHVAATYDGSRAADGIRLYIDGQPQEQTVLLDEINQTFATKEPLRIGGGGGSEMRFRGRIEAVRVYGRDLSTDDIRILATRESIATILAAPAAGRSAAQRLKVEQCFLEQHAPEPIRAAHRELVAARRELRAFTENLPTTMVMEESPTPRAAHVLIRGQYDQPGPRALPGVPERLLAWPAGAPANRLGLARWLVDPRHPLTGRVAVNRVWQLYFGTGLVKTVEDFGSQGEWPLHPEVLDTLASEFLRSGWDVKRLHRTIVTSGVYRQSSQLRAELRDRDPENRLLARGARLRLPVETVRDQALAASGLLVEQIGGPSVKPPQPAGLWNELTGGDDYVAGTGADWYRRSLYTFWKRTIPPPSMAVFDAATREFCTVREARTNTPLQALTLLNEPTYVAAARALAQRVMQAETDPAKRIELAFQLVLGRQPTARELEILASGLDRHLARNRTNASEAAQDDELSAYSALCGTILNLDEAVTKE